MRKLAVAAAVIGLPLTLGGCVVFKGPITGVQQDVVGNVRVSFTICASGADDGPGGESDHPGCLDDGNSGHSDGIPISTQLLIGFRVPRGTGAPQTFTSTQPTPNPPADGPLTLSRSAGYERELERLAPAPAGFVWVGYLSSVYTHDSGAVDTPAQQASASVDFVLPRAADGGPFPGPFRVRPVVGFRRGASNEDFARSVSCGDSLNFGDNQSSTLCIDSPTGDGYKTDLQFPTRDLGIVAGSATADPGQTVQLPFNANLNGTLPAATTFSVSAATNLPGVSVAPSPAAFTPAANASTRITVPVAIPKTAGPGTYGVSVTARLPNGQSRIGVSGLTVRDRQKPVASRLAISPKTLRPQAPSIAAAARASYRLSEAATMSFRVQRCRKVKRRTRCKTLKGSFRHVGKGGTNRFRFTGFLRNRALKRGSYRLVGTPTDLAKNKGKSVRASFRIKR
jgi:hypothetical protein